MKELTLKQLAAWCGGEIHPDGADAAVTGTQIDSRLIRKGDLFVAIPGEKADGHDFISKAREAGAAAALVSRVVDDPLPQILVVDTVLAYGDIARAYREAAGVDVVAITGSVGKTTTKEMIACVLAGKYRVSKTQGNHNNNLGLPITIFEMPADTQEAVLELGMNHFGEMHYLTTIAKPNIVVITNIGTMHIEHLGTREGILKAKLEIMDGIQDDGVAVFNKCIENVRPLVEVKARRVGGATYQVPTEVKPLRSTSLAMRWLIGAAQSRKGRPMAEKLAEEIILGSKKEGTAFKKREDVHKMAEANRAFAHFKW